MEIATVSDKGQITIPISVRRNLKLKGGDKVVIQEENGRYYFDNAALVAFTRVAEAFDGEAKKAGFNSEDELQEYMKKEVRKEVRGY
ncbi:MAG: AbrB/MazE/SpoVT family DNA-binding domain-containing protein [Mogibacterium sp.]|nr:AbrB/MazE/SpoVT family DNA-binding domain-containing protein [Mogibacterium sp.]